MILNGNQRGGAKDLALHLMKTENERVEIHELRGVMSQDLMGALYEMYAVSRGTRCQQFMYSLSLNPPKGKNVSIADFERAIAQAEKRLGLSGQPRAVVFHEKNGRRHCHVVWSRIDINRMRAVQMSHDHEKLTELSKELFLEYGWEMPRGLEVRGERDPTNYTHAEYQQAQRIGRNAADIKAEIQAAWTQSDTKAALEAALAERGYVLAKGDRVGFVIIDRHGEIYSLPRMAGVKTKDVRARIGDGADLPTIEQVKAQWTQERPVALTPQPDYTPEDALARVTRHHAAFTLPMMERLLKPVMADTEERHGIIKHILQSDMIAIERQMAETARDMMRHVSHKVDSPAVQRALFNLNNQIARETDGKSRLSAEQQQAIRHMANDRQLSLVVGVAGAGKTTIMAGAKEALEAQGYRVRGAAFSGIAAAGLQDIGMNASTLHSLEARLRLAQKMMDDNIGKPLTKGQMAFIQSAMLTSKDVLIVDEAGMVSAKQLARIIDLSKQSGAKLVLVGDPAQLQSIEAGAAFRTLLERNEFVSLNDVRRQKEEWQREATRHLSQGDAAKALYAYGTHSCIHRRKTRSDAKEQLVADVMKAQDATPGQSRLVLAYTRQDVAYLNAMIKEEMVKRGKVSARSTDIAVTVKEADSERKETQGFAVGDRILFRENNRDLGVMNGSFGTLKAIERSQFHVALDNGKTVSFSPQEYSRFQLGYAATVHQSQGMTVDNTYVFATPHFDRHTTYVAMSRHKENVKLYVSKDDFRDNVSLQRSLGREGEKLSTLDFTDAQTKERSLPEQSREQRQQGVPTLRDEFMRRAQSQPLEQSHSQTRDFQTLYDEFMRRANPTHADPEKEQKNHRFHRGPTPEM